MSRPRAASIEAKVRLHALEQQLEHQSKQIEELESFKERIALGQKWLLCAFYTIGGIVATTLAVIQIVKELHVRIGG